jgi:6-phosphogluconolactonase
MRTLLMATLLSAEALAQSGGPVRFYVGTLDEGPGSHITLCELDPASGRLTQKETFQAGKGPGYVTLSPNRRYLYSCNHDSELWAFRVAPETGRLTPLNQQPAQGMNPCHVSVHPSGKLLLAANYTSGDAVALPIAPDGQLKPVSSLVKFSGSGPNADRQDAPHAHYAISTPDGRYAYVADLGTDRVMNFVVNAETGTLTPNPAQAHFQTRPGEGPRHLVFDATGQYLFVLSELDGTLRSCRVGKDGVLTEVQTVPTIPADFKEPNKGAAIRLHPNGRFVYVSNRGHDSISGYQIGTDGSLTPVDQQVGRMKYPRDFNLDPSGRYLLVGSRDTNEILVYTVDDATGKLRYQSVGLSLSKPVCIQFANGRQ